MPDLLRAAAGLAMVAAAGLSGGEPRPASAQTDQSTAPRAPMSMESVTQFLEGAGLKACEVTEIDPFVSRVNGAVRSLSIGVAEDCADYDQADPTVANVHQFSDRDARDAMVESLKNLRFRAVRAYGNVWVVDDFVVILLGPQRDQVQSLLQAEYRRRHKNSAP